MSGENSSMKKKRKKKLCSRDEIIFGHVDSIMQHVENWNDLSGFFSSQKCENDCDIPAEETTCSLKTPWGLKNKTSFPKFGSCEDGRNPVAFLTNLFPPKRNQTFNFILSNPKE